MSPLKKKTLGVAPRQQHSAVVKSKKKPVLTIPKEKEDTKQPTNEKLRQSKVQEPKPCISKISSKSKAIKKSQVFSVPDQKKPCLQISEYQGKEIDELQVRQKLAVLKTEIKKEMALFSE